MDIRKVDDRLSVTGQIEPSDIAALSAAGFKSIICNRPDNEGPGQPSHKAVEQAAAQMGIELHYVPVVSGGITMDDVNIMKLVLANCVSPILAYCRSGARSAHLYQLATSE